MAKLAKILFIPVPHPEHAPGRSFDSARTERRARRTVLVLGFAALTLFGVGVFVSQRQDTARLASLSAEARRGLYARTLGEVETICRDPAAATGSLRDHCIAQARFLRELPECTAACQSAAAFVLPHAHR